LTRSAGSNAPDSPPNAAGPAWRGACLALLALLLLAVPGRAEEPARVPALPLCLVLAPSRQPYTQVREAFRVMGYETRTCRSFAEVEQFRRPGTLLVVPGAESQNLNTTQVGWLCARVKGGLPVLVDGRSAFNMALGLTYLLTPMTVTAYRCPSMTPEPVRLPAPMRVPRIHPLFTATRHALAVEGDAPLIVSGTFGEGGFVYTALPLVPPQPALDATLPFLVHTVRDVLGVKPELEAQAMHYYLDWGFHFGADPEQLVRQLAADRVNLVYLSAWYEHDAYTAFVRGFISAAHRRGILVYCWFEFPMVSEAFWLAHPEWREITATGAEAHLDWRRLMALTDPACLRAVCALMREKLAAADWDGANLAELYFESPRCGTEAPEMFTPMHPSFREAFRARYQVDPLAILQPDSAVSWRARPELFAQLLAFRIETLTGITETLLRELAAITAERSDLGVTVTTMDTRLDPVMRERLGLDIEQLLGLRRVLPFALQVEDPYTTWHQGPARYATMGAWHRERLGAQAPLILNLNVVDRWDGAPLKRVAGLELCSWVRMAASEASAVSVYAYNTLLPADRALLPEVIAGQVSWRTVEGQRQYTSPWPLIWYTDTRAATPVVDGRPWAAYDTDRVLLPAGTHAVAVQPAPARPDAPRVIACSGTLRHAEYRQRRVAVTYSASSRCYVSLSWLPAGIQANGQALPLVNVGTPEAPVIALPAGTHTVLLDPPPAAVTTAASSPAGTAGQNSPAIHPR